MSTKDIQSLGVTQGAMIARAAQLAAYYQGDLDRETLARDELEALAALDFSAMSAGRELANEMIVGGFLEVLEAFNSLWRLDTLGLTFGAAPRAAEKALSSYWTGILSENITSELTLVERRTLVKDLNVALWGYAAELERLDVREEKCYWWNSLVRRIRPQSLTVGVNVLFFRLVGTWSTR